MFGTHFYHKKVRTCVSIFGKLFNNIYVVRPNSQVKVPLSYAPKQKYLERVRENADLSVDTQVAIKLPRMSFEITSFAYDAQRQLTKVSNFNTIGTANTNRQKFYSPVPYSINFQLNVYAKTQDDALQIVEQILPFFQPDYTVTINAIPGLDIKRDVPIILNSVNYDDSYSGDFTTRRAVIYTLQFTAKTYLFGPASTQKVIKTVQSDIYTDTDITNKAIEQRIVITPNPTRADADDDFGFTTTITDFDNGGSS